MTYYVVDNVAGSHTIKLDMASVRPFMFGVSRLELKNYRKFKSLEIDFAKDMTVLTAVNGGGKSAVLQALALACSSFVNSLAVESGVKGFSSSDHRLVCQEGGGSAPAYGDMELTCWGRVGDGGKEERWSLSRDGAVRNAKTRYGKASNLRKYADQLRLQSEAGQGRDSALAPLVVFYDTRRQSRRLTKSKMATSRDRFEGYRDCLSVGDNSRVFRDWFVRLSKRCLQLEKGSAPFLNVMGKLATVRNAIDKSLSIVGLRHLEWDAERDALVMKDENGVELTLDQLSDGSLNVCFLVADLACRAVRLNPAFSGDGLLKKLQGLVLIDEVDMYLHPGWQQVILPVLKEIFPKIQFIVSTHSPQVLTTVKKGQIRILKQDEDGNCHAYQPGRSPYGREAANALENIMGVHSSPFEEDMKRIQKLEESYVSGRFDEGDALRKGLEEEGIEVDDEDVDMWKFLSGKLP